MFEEDKFEISIWSVLLRLFLFAVNLAVIAAIYFFNIVLIGLCSGCSSEAIEAAYHAGIRRAWPMWISVGVLLYSLVPHRKFQKSADVVLTVGAALSVLLGIAVFSWSVSG